MSITIPALRIAGSRHHFITERGHCAETLSEIAFDTLLAQLAQAVNPGAEQPTKDAIADVVEHALQLALDIAGFKICPCGHPFGDHLGNMGCLAVECGCRHRRPAAFELAPEPVLAGGEAR